MQKVLPYVQNRVQNKAQGKKAFLLLRKVQAGISNERVWGSALLKMQKVNLIVDEKGCKKACPIPLELFPNVEKGIKQVRYNKKTRKASISFDEKIISKSQVLQKLRKAGYAVKEEK